MRGRTQFGFRQRRPALFAFGACCARQEDVADHMVKMITGAMDELVLNNPQRLSTDVGSVIDAEAQQNLAGGYRKMKGGTQRR